MSQTDPQSDEETEERAADEVAPERGLDYYFEDFNAALESFDKFRWYVARKVGVVALFYGIVTWKAYYMLLGAAAIVLFWIFDRLDPLGVKPPEMNEEVTSEGGDTEI